MRGFYLALTIVLSLAVASCGGSPTAPSELRGGVLATFDVGGERFRTFVTNPITIAQLFALRDGSGTATIPSGRVRRGAGSGSHNAPFQWHLDAADIHLTELAMELCDGRPSHIERNIDEFVERVGRYCPWGARLVDLRDLR